MLSTFGVRRERVILKSSIQYEPKIMGIVMLDWLSYKNLMDWNTSVQRCSWWMWEWQRMLSRLIVMLNTYHPHSSLRSLQMVSSPNCPLCTPMTNWCGARQCGTLGNIPNPRVGPSFSFFCTKSYIRRSRDVIRRVPQHHTNRQNRQKHRHHGGRAALLSSDVELMVRNDRTCGQPVHGIGRGRGRSNTVVNHKL